MNGSSIISDYTSLNEIARVINMDIQELKNAIIPIIDKHLSKQLKPEVIEVSKNIDTSNYSDVINSFAINFSDEQLEFMNKVILENCNIMLYAPAGYGKSSVINATIQLILKCIPKYTEDELYDMYNIYNPEFINLDHVACCASTGKAASIIGGTTVHSFLGIGLAKDAPNNWYERLCKYKNLQAKKLSIMALKYLIIDEISMIGSGLLDNISEYLQLVRKNKLPFGGIQIIMVGDICQLGPIKDRFLFNSKEYKRGEVQLFKLTKCFRQDNPDFLNILDDIRYGNCSKSSYEFLKKCIDIEDSYSNGLVPMKLASTNDEVNMINYDEFKKIAKDKQSCRYPIQNTGKLSKKLLELHCKNENIPEIVELVVDTQIIVTANISKQINNGTQGRVIHLNETSIDIEYLHLGEINRAKIEYFAFKDPDAVDIYKAGTLFQYLPVKLGYASTIHKAQGMTLDLLEIDMKKIFAHGQAYTAISRVRDPRGLIIRNLTKSAFKCDDTVKKFAITC